MQVYDRRIEEAKSLQFDLCGRDRRQSLRIHDARELYEFSLPTLVEKCTCERWLSRKFSDESVLIGGIAGRYRDLCPFRGVGDGGDMKVFLQALPTSLVNYSRGG